MSMKRLRSLPLLLLAIAAGVLLNASAIAQDVITIGSVSAIGSSADVPIYVRDVSGTPLGIDQPAGLKIQSLSIKVDYSPASAVQSVTFSRAGITTNLTPIFETKPSSPGSATLLVAFQESTNPVPFTLNAPAPGNQVARLAFVLSPSAAPGTSITLSLDPALTQLTDQGGSAATKETEANGHLALVDGTISIPSLTVSLQPQIVDVQLGASETLTARASATVGSNTTVTLSSSKPGVASVPTSVVIAAGQRNATFGVAGVSLGNATITATLGSSTATANVVVIDCPVPAIPVAAAPAEATVSTSYSVSWASVASATDYELDESTNSNFQGATTTTISGTSASFSHDIAGTRFFYRVRARNRNESCNETSAYSTSVSVLIVSAPQTVTRYLPVAGSLPGGFGSYFKTSFALYNPREFALSGKIVFHPAGTPGSATDPSLRYSVQPLETIYLADLLPAIGVATGLGSADVVSDPGSPIPVSTARVFNDAGDAGTTGFTEELLGAGDALAAGSSGALIAPADVTRFRLNVGVRTLEAGATMTITVRDSAGTTVKSTTASFGPTFFIQQPASSLLDGYALAGGESITFAVTSGGAFVYGATTDNTTNDPSVQFARRIE